MYGVVNAEEGNERALGCRIEVSGKSGTAQVMLRDA